MIFKQIRVQGVFAQTRKSFKMALNMIARDKRSRRLITHVFPIERFDEAMKRAMSGECVKVVIKP